MLDIERLRADTPGIQQVIHLNNAGASLQPAVVADAVMQHLRREVETGGYEAADEAAERLANVYKSVGKLIGAQASDIAVVENATRAWDMFFYSLPLQAGDLVVTSSTEYASNFVAYLQLRRSRGIEVIIIPNDEYGQVSVPALAALLRLRPVRLISLPAIATNGGPLQPIDEIGALARQAGAWFLLDACQAAGHIPLDVGAIGCHALTATSRKYLRGPRGVGFLYVEPDLCEQLEPVFLDLHAATWIGPDDYRIRSGAKRFENWEGNIAAKLGLGAAVDYALSLGVDSLWQRIRSLAAELRAHLRAIPGVTVCDQGAIKTGIVTFTVAGRSAAAVRDRLYCNTPRINVSLSSAASTLLDMQARNLSSVVRASVHAFNTDAELHALCKAIAGL